MDGTRGLARAYGESNVGAARAEAEAPSGTGAGAGAGARGGGRRQRGLAMDMSGIGRHGHGAVYLLHTLAGHLRNINPRIVSGTRLLPNSMTDACHLVHP